MNRFTTSSSLGLLLWVALALPPFRELLEASLVGHLLLQMPLLAITGMLLSSGLPAAWRELYRRWDPTGIAAVLIAIATALYWMMPRHMDAALLEPSMELAKFISLPLLLGIPLALSWKCLPVVAKGLVWSQWIAMLVVLAWLYRAAPVRVCNNYLQDQQVLASWALLTAALLSALWVMKGAFISGHRRG